MAEQAWRKRKDRPPPLVDVDTPYKDDVACQLFVAFFPEGATLDMVGAAIGVTRERARQIEDRALKKLFARAEEYGLHAPVASDDADAVRSFLRSCFQD